VLSIATLITMLVIVIKRNHKLIYVVAALSFLVTSGTST
jgi:hypothetical protein